jgi:hypothetical protein
VVGTFTATGTDAVIQQNLVTGVGSINAVVVRQLSVSLDPATANFKATVGGAVGSQTLNFTWATDHFGWQLYTNAIGLNAVGSWFPVPGSAAATSLSLPIDPTKTNVFYQLRHP